MELTVTGLSHDGRGIAHIDGKATFVQGGLAGETVVVELLRKRGRFNEARVVEVTKASPQRVTPQCAHFGVCGGCSLQHMSPAAQIELKQNTLLEQLQHVGGVTPQNIMPPLLGPVWGYRRRARLGVKYVVKKSRVLVGFREKSSRFLADLQSCEILYSSVGKKLTVLSEAIAKLSNFREIPQIEVAVADNVTALVFRHLQPFNDDDLTILRDLAVAHNFQIYLQPGNASTVHALDPDTEQTLIYALPDYHLEFAFHPCDFVQINADINHKMIAQALNLLALKSSDTVLDLFCGLGNFSLPLAQQAGTVVGVEGEQSLVERAQANAAHNQIDNAEFHVADLASDLANQAWLQRFYDKVLIDPPRTGAADVLKYLVGLQAERIVYVSCNTATLARDAGLLKEQGYQLVQVGVMDMFPHTQHVEAMVLFQKG